MPNIVELAETFDRLQRECADDESFRTASKEFAFAMFRLGKTVRQIGRRLELTTEAEARKLHRTMRS
jgi:hypothetical protein